jgi:hypothetical protein
MLPRRLKSNCAGLPVIIMTGRADVPGALTYLVTLTRARGVDGGVPVPRSLARVR